MSAITTHQHGMSALPAAASAAVGSGRSEHRGRRARIALATCTGLPDLNAEGALLCSALGRFGVDAVAAIWNAPLDWEAFDAVVIRTAEDYFRDATRFPGWECVVA